MMIKNLKYQFKLNQLQEINKKRVVLVALCIRLSQKFNLKRKKRRKRRRKKKNDDKILYIIKSYYIFFY